MNQPWPAPAPAGRRTPSAHPSRPLRRRAAQTVTRPRVAAYSASNTVSQIRSFMKFSCRNRRRHSGAARRKDRIKTGEGRCKKWRKNGLGQAVGGLCGRISAGGLAAAALSPLSTDGLRSGAQKLLFAAQPAAQMASHCVRVLGQQARRPVSGPRPAAAGRLLGRQSAASARRFCRAPRNSPGPRSCKSWRAISKPSVVSYITFSRALPGQTAALQTAARSGFRRRCAPPAAQLVIAPGPCARRVRSPSGWRWARPRPLR